MYMHVEGSPRLNNTFVFYSPKPFDLLDGYRPSGPTRLGFYLFKANNIMQAFKLFFVLHWFVPPDFSLITPEQYISGECNTGNEIGISCLYPYNDGNNYSNLSELSPQVQRKITYSHSARAKQAINSRFASGVQRTCGYIRNVSDMRKYIARKDFFFASGCLQQISFAGWS